MKDLTEKVLAVIGVIGGALGVALLSFNLAKAMKGPASAPPVATIRPYGVPFTDAERMARHQATYGSDQLPPKGTGLQGNAVAGSRPYGVPLTDAERTTRHQTLFGSDQLPPRGTGLQPVAPHGTVPTYNQLYAYWQAYYQRQGGQS